MDARLAALASLADKKPIWWNTHGKFESLERKHGSHERNNWFIEEEQTNW
jgi:hypothetical protein